MGYLTSKFLRDIGFVNIKGKDELSFVVNRIGFNLARRLGALMDKLADDETYAREFYDVKNTNLDVSLTVSNAIHYDYFVHVLEYLEENVDEIGDNILFLGCDCGIEPCFLAKLKPNATITAVDITKAAIKNGQELAARLDVKVNFQCVSYKDVNGTFDTIISFRFAHEATSCTKSSEHEFDRLDNKRMFHKVEVLPVAEKIGELLSEYGVLISLERFWEIRQLAWMDALNSNGVETIALEEVRGSQNEKFILTFAQKYPQDLPYEVIWHEYYSQNCDYSAPQFKGIQSEIFISLKAGKLINGYYAVKDNKQYGKMAVYRHRYDDTALIVEQGDLSMVESSVYDLSDMDLILSKIEEYAALCRNSNFDVVAIED